jgi:spore coat polysaccharide biosynthesis predicted glycosyltransferase SpsG
MGIRAGEGHTDADFAEAMSSCCFAISGSGVTLYDLLASGVPTIAVAFDRIQLRTAEAFHELGAVLSAGLLERLSPAVLLRSAKEMIENRPLVQRITEAGQMLVDGKGVSRVVEIVRRQLWLTSQEKTYTAC